MLDDTMLLEGLRANDQQAWEELVGRFGDQLLRAASFHGGVQETFVRSTRAVDTWRVRNRHLAVGVRPEPEPTSAACPRIS